MKSICVFCGASSTPDNEINSAIEELGGYLVSKNLRLVYGGGSTGLMGQVADSVLRAGGEVTGVIPTFLNTKEVAHQGLTKLIEVESMHQRKLKMFELSDGFIALPGGFGTLEEIMEVLTWRQLALHSKPLVFLNLAGFYEPLIQLFETMERSQLLSAQSRALIRFCSDVSELKF